MSIITSDGIEPLLRPDDPRPSGPGSRGPSGVDVGSATLSLGEDGLTPEQVKRWHYAFTPYRNYAGDKKIADRALSWAKEHYRIYRDSTTDLRAKWQSLWDLYHGWSLANERGGGVHVPEVYKMVETLVPRIEEALLNYDPWFAVRARRQTDQYQERRIQQYLDYELDANKWPSLVPYAARAYMIHGFCAIKSWWAYETKFVIERDVSRSTGTDGRPRFDITTRDVEKLIYEGPRLALVNNYRYVVDTSVDDPQRGLISGDICDMTFDQIAALGEMDVFENWQKLSEAQPSVQEENWERQMSQTVWPYNGLMGRLPDGAPRVIPVFEAWGPLD